MANVYRKAAKDVHRSIVSGGARYDVLGCNLDAGGTWGPGIPPGPRCSVCFAGLATASRNRRRAAIGGGAAALVLVAAAIAGQPDGDPVSSPTPSFIASGSATPSASPVLVTPEPSLALPTETPALTPFVTQRPDDGGVIVVPPPATPRPTPPPQPPAPTCFHPGHNYGVSECRWPHN